MKLAMTIGQQGLWYVSQADDRTSAAYNVVLALAGSGKVDAAVLAASLEDVVRRHPQLGAYIAEQDEQPCFVPGKGAPVAVDTAAGTLDAIIGSESRRVFDFMQGPLLRATLVCDAGAPAGIVFTFAHLVMDGASVPVFLDQLAQAYGARAGGAAPVFAQQPDSGAQRAQRERDALASADGQQRLAALTRSLQDLPAQLALPATGPGEQQSAYVAGSHVLALPAALGEQVHQFARSNGSTPAAVYLAAFELLLWQYAGQGQFAVSVPVSNRSEEDAAAIGYFTSLAIIRADLAAGMTGLALIDGVTDAVFGLLDHCDIPFPVLVRSLKEAGMQHTGGLMQLGFNYEYLANTVWHVGEAQLRLASGTPHYTKHQLKLDVEERPGAVRCTLTFDSRGFDAGMIERMLRHYGLLLAALLRDPQARLDALPVLSEAERRQMLVEWNASGAAPVHDECIHQAFEAQAARDGSAIAVEFDGASLTYGDLNARANQLAHHLRTLGVMPDTLVGICMERSLEMVIGLMGILKAGGAYVPVDPAYPAERQLYMLANSAAPVLLTMGGAGAQLAHYQGQVICLERDWAAIAAQPAHNPASRTLPENLAYCIYTSGSTGMPKGALNTHLGCLNLLRWYMSDALPGPDRERILLSSSLSFDLTQKNILGALIAGATLIVPRGDVTDIDSIMAAAAAHRPTRLNCAPSAYRALLQSVPADSLKTVVLGGEPIDTELAAQLAGRGITLVNSYGPTECADVAIYHVAPPGTAQGAIPLGKPIQHVQIYILDRQLNPVPVGVAGEIHIAGIGVGRGYLKRPDLTAEKFIPNPFGAPGSRMYKTGDMGRYRADGTIDFLGRNDHQVKIRGIRIEPGEIEHALLRCPGVREAAVMVRAEGAAEARLVAYVSASAGALTAQGLRAALSGSLPGAMLPAAFVFLDALPLNPNGKIDRQALPAPQQAACEVVPGDAPRTPLEASLAVIWAEILNVPQIGINDNFFVMGGHSLLATQVVSRSGAHLGLTVPVRTLFDAPTIAAFAASLDALAAAPAPGAGQRPGMVRQARTRSA